MIPCTPLRVDTRWSSFGEGGFIYDDMMISCTPLRVDTRWSSFGEGGVIYDDMMITCTPLRLDNRWEYIIVEIIMCHIGTPLTSGYSFIIWHVRIVRIFVEDSDLFCGWWLLCCWLVLKPVNLLSFLWWSRRYEGLLVQPSLMLFKRFSASGRRAASKARGRSVVTYFNWA